MEEIFVDQLKEIRWKLNNGHIWLEALSNRNLTTHTYDEELARKMVKDILSSYFPELKDMHDKLEGEL